MLACAAVLIFAFIVIESRARAPIVPLWLFRRVSLVVANLVPGIWYLCC